MFNVLNQHLLSYTYSGGRLAIGNTTVSKVHLINITCSNLASLGVAKPITNSHTRKRVWGQKNTCTLAMQKTGIGSRVIIAKESGSVEPVIFRFHRKTGK